MHIDLQIHSTYSDGYLTPTQLAEFLHNQGVKIASLTDHNTVRGLTEFERACRKYGIKTIPGIELYVKSNGHRFNILWYNFKDDARLHKLLRESQLRRKNKVRSTLEMMQGRGFKINIEKILDRYNHYIPLNRLVDDILEHSANKKIIAQKLKTSKPREEDIIREFFYNGGKSKLHESYIHLERIISIKKKLGGQLVLNHPGKYNKFKKEYIEKLKKIGLDGIEVISPHHSIGATFYFQYLARQYNFIETGGSDFHRFEGNGYPIQHSWQYVKIDRKYLKGVEKIIG